MNSSRKASLGFIFTTILIDVIGIAIIIPVAPALVMDLTGKSENEVAITVGLLMSSYAIAQFLFSPLLGTLSDTYGRRPIILLSLLGLGLDYVLHAFAPTLAWLFAGRILAGICGASFTVANAYIADISSKEDRAKNFGMVGAAFGLGFIVGPVIGGLAGAEWGPRAPFIVAAILSLLNFMYGVFILPESLAAKNRRAFKLKNANPIGALKHLRKYPLIVGLVITFFLLHMAGEALPATWVLFTNFQFGWGEGEVGISLAVVGVLVAFVQGFFTGRMVKKFGDKTTVIIGGILMASGMLLYSIAFEGWMLYLYSIPYCLGGIAGPTLQGIISNQVSDKEQGELQGALTSVMSLTTIISPLVMTFTFEQFTKPDMTNQFAGAPYLLAGLIMTLGLIIAWRTLNKRPELLIKAQVELDDTLVDDEQINRGPEGE